MTFRHNTDIGQNFLRDLSVADWMTRRAAVTAAERVLEIGPGDGALTKCILSGECEGLDAIELDTRLAPELERIASSDSRLALHWGDAVTFDYSRLAPPAHVIANLPYHITTPLIWSLLESFSNRGLKYMLLMTQMEAANRIASGAGERQSNPLGITIAALGGATVVRSVPRSAFYPRPRVDSAIVEITLSRESPAAELPRDALWRRLLAGSFATRRKTLVNNWAGSFGIPRDKSLAILRQRSLSHLSRPEELSLDSWLALREDETLGALSEKNKRTLP
jgi:16S rRNA (adenine1518-N6/adenine1519-N6)-dimethyltransferase